MYSTLIAWVGEYTDTLNLVVNLAMLCVWVLYFQLLLQSFRRQKRSNILINRGAGSDPDSRCIISNMSTSPLYVQAILVEIRCGSKTWETTISDTEKLGEGESASKSMERTGQGPLREGEFMDAGSFAYLVKKALGQERLGSDTPQEIGEIDFIKITVAAVYTAVDRLVGACRTFRVEKRGDGLLIVPEGALAKQLTSRSARHRLLREVMEAT